MPTAGKSSRRTQGRQPKTPLTKERIVTAAVQLIEKRGAKAFSMRSLASQLGVFPSALTWHVGDRSNLVAAISAHWMRAMVLPDASGDWKDWMREMASRYRAAAHNSPNVARLISGEIVNVPSAFDLPEAVVGGLASTGLPDAEIVHAYNALVGAVVGFVDLELARLPDETAARAHEIEREIRSVQPDRYPNLHRHMDRLADHAIALRWTSGVEAPLDKSFDYLVELLITGLSARLDAVPLSSGGRRASSTRERASKPRK